MGKLVVTIRAAIAADASRVCELHASAVRAMCSDHYAKNIIGGWLLDRTPSGYLAPIGRGAIFVAEVCGRIVGFGEAAPGVVIAVYVDPSAAGRGIGGSILNRALTVARTGNNGPIRVESTLNARAFYEHHGFREVKRSNVKRNHVEVAIVVMEHRAA